jgi:alpha-L-fucosidase
MQTGAGESQTVSNWIESSKAANFNDWVKVGNVDVGQFPAAQSNVVNFSNPNGYIYQSIGTYAGEAALDISGKAIRRFPNAQRAFRPFTIAIYQTATNINGNTGIHPSALSGSTLVAAVNISDAELGLTGNYSAPQMTNFLRTIPLTFATLNRKLWIVFGALAGNDETALDDLAITINTNYVPPPPPGPIAYSTLQVLSNSDTAAVIVEKAARLLPRTNQVAWMRLEQTYFAHFGPDTFNGVELGTGQESPSVFNPAALDPAQWVREIKNAGGKLLVLVCKHHDGFCLWPSRYTTQSVASSTWLGGQGNVVRAVADAAHAQGLKLGFYLSPADLYQVATNPANPAGYYGDNSSNSPSVIPTDPASFISNPLQGRAPTPGFTNYTYAVDDYNRYFLNQLYELLTEYGPITEVWFDGANPTAGVNESYAYAAWYDLIRHVQPDAIIFGKGPDARWVGNENGAARNSEWSVIPIPFAPDTYTWPDMTAADLGSRARLTPGSTLWWYPAEADVPILSGWFWSASKSVKSASQLVDIFYSSVGLNANRILNLSPDTRGVIPDNQLTPLRQMAQIINNTFGINLASGATVTADTSNATNSPTLALDNNLDTWWEVAPGQTNGTLTLVLSSNLAFDVVALQEAVAQRSQRIENFSIDWWNGSAYVTATNLTTVGHKRLVRFSSPITTSQVRVRITGARFEPTLAAIGLFKQATSVGPPVISNRDVNGLVTLSNSNGYAMVFTLDGSLPTTSSTIYAGPIAMPFGGTILANSLAPSGQLGALASKSFAGCAPTGWTVTSVDSEEIVLTNAAAANAIDGNPATIWSTRSNADLALPHTITIDMGTPRWIGGFAYQPRQDGNSNGTVAQYRFETSVDGLGWTTNITAGTFVNMPGYFDARIAGFAAVEARYFRFTALQEINGNGWTTAAELSVIPAGFDAWRRDFGMQTNSPLSDPEGNGNPLLMEYYRGIIPGTLTNATLAAVGLNAGVFQFDVRRQPGRFDLTQSFQTSTNLQSWVPAAGVLTNSVAPELDGTETLHLQLPIPPGPENFYLRLVIGQN